METIESDQPCEWTVSLILNPKSAVWEYCVGVPGRPGLGASLKFGTAPTRNDAIGHAAQLMRSTTPLDRAVPVTYKFTRPDGVRVTTILEGGKAHIMEEHGELAVGTLKMLERSQFTDAEERLLREVSAID